MDMVVAGADIRDKKIRDDPTSSHEPQLRFPFLSLRKGEGEGGYEPETSVTE
jgi:hypothetical protein